MSENRNIIDWIDESFDWSSPIAHEQARQAETDLVEALTQMKRVIDKTLDAYEKGGNTAWQGLSNLASGFDKTDRVTPISSRIYSAVIRYTTLAQTVTAKHGEK